MSPSELLSAALAFAALLLSLPGALLALRQLRKPSPPTRSVAVPTPRRLIWTRLALFGYAAAMVAVAGILFAQEKAAVDNVPFYAALALIAATLGILVKGGRGWAVVTSLIFSAISLVYFAFLGVSSLADDGFTSILLPLPVIAALCVAVIALTTSGRRAA